MQDLLALLLTPQPPPSPNPDLRGWWKGHLERCEALVIPYHRAVMGGFVADRLGFAFASGYREALQALLQSKEVTASSKKTMALCATEEGGGHPRAIHTSLRTRDGVLRLDGSKRWTTLGSFADELLIVANRGEGEDGRPRLCVVKIPSDRDGVTVRDMGALPFVPEIPHATLTLSDVRVDAHDLLAGDGYLDYLKPFRTVEDLHVQGALLGWLLQVARRSDWPEKVVARLCEQIVAGGALATMPSLAPAVHVALAGLLESSRVLLAEHEALWDRVDEATRTRWHRDQALLQVAAKARSKRIEAAWRDLTS